MAIQADPALGRLPTHAGTRPKGQGRRVSSAFRWVVAAIAGAGGLGWGSTRPQAPPPPVQLGIYDPERAFANAQDISIEHFFVHWNVLKADEFRSWVRYAQDRRRRLLVTVEPFTRAANWVDGREGLVGDILAGGFDRTIASVCREVAAADAPVLVRWGHEMDDRSGPYP